MKILGNKKHRRNYRYIANLNDYHNLSKEEFDIAINGVPFEGKHYPLSYEFWGKERYRKVIITLTGESGTLIGESVITRLTQHFDDSVRGIVQIGERITDLDYSVLQFV